MFFNDFFYKSLWLGIFAVITFLSYFLGICFSVSAQARPTLLVLNKADATLAIIDPNEMKILGKVATGDSPHEVVVSADGKLAIVANYGAQTPGNSFSVIDIAAQKEVRRVDLSPLFRPHGVQEVGGKIYFTSETNRLIGRYDPAANKVDWLMGTGQNASHMIAVTGDRKKIYTANIASDTVTAFEFQNVPPGPSKITHIPVGKQPEAIDVAPDGREVWVGLNAEGAVDIIDTATNKVKEKLNLGERPYRVKFFPDGAKVLMTVPNTKELLIYETATRKEIKRIKLESAPLGVVFSKDGKTAFVTAVQPDAVLKIDMEKFEVTGKAETGKVPDGIALTGM